MAFKQKLIVGVDEAGRGAWAGPLIAAAVALDSPLPGLKDSKRITPKNREELYPLILNSAHVGIGQIASADIDKYGLSWAQRAAMLQAVKDLSMDISDCSIIVDGSIDYLKLPGSKALVKADAKVPAVMAASIIAKVYRDRLMAELDEDYPGYGFAAHKGYGTRAHSLALDKRGICRHHRQSYRPVAVFL